VLAIGVQS